jgi:hypothetical protein
MKILDFDIRVRELIPSVGKYEYFAVLNSPSVVLDNGETKSLKLDLGEAYGTTSAEALEKMQARFDEWRVS